MLEGNLSNQAGLDWKVIYQTKQVLIFGPRLQVKICYFEYRKRLLLRDRWKVAVTHPPPGNTNTHPNPAPDVIGNCAGYKHNNPMWKQQKK
jgi:hypothetical protein